MIQNLCPPDKDRPLYQCVAREGIIKSDEYKNDHDGYYKRNHDHGKICKGMISLGKLNKVVLFGLIEPQYLLSKIPHTKKSINAIQMIKITAFCRFALSLLRIKNRIKRNIGSTIKKQITPLLKK